MPSRKFSLGDYRYGFNGKENDNELKGEGNQQDYGMRISDPRLGRFLSVDPLTQKYPELTSYQFASNSPIAGIDIDGLEFFYSADGKFLGRIGASQQVYTADKIETSARESTDISGNLKIEKYQRAVNAKSLNVNHDVFIGLAAAVHKESSGNQTESNAIGNAHMNFLLKGGSKNLKSLDDIVMYDNTVVQGATADGYKKFSNMNEVQRNAKFAISATVNALGYYNGLSGFSDFSENADAWDGIDLISTKFSNDHRDWTWSSDSKDLLLDYKAKYKGGIGVSKFKYSDKKYDIKATKIVGKTIFQEYNTPRGGKKQSPVRFSK